MRKLGCRHHESRRTRQTNARPLPALPRRSRRGTGAGWCCTQSPERQLEDPGQRLRRRRLSDCGCAPGGRTGASAALPSAEFRVVSDLVGARGQRPAESSRGRSGAAGRCCAYRAHPSRSPRRCRRGPLRASGTPAPTSTAWCSATGLANCGPKLWSTCHPADSVALSACSDQWVQIGN
jgi:hypothetical protein